MWGLYKVVESFAYNFVNLGCPRFLRVWDFLAAGLIHELSFEFTTV
jgi:hypothetical protein